MKPIIASTDFSLASLNAVNYAADLAVATNSNLMIVHICQLPVVYGEIAVAVDGIDQRIASAEEKIKNLKKQIEIRTKGKINIETDVKPHGSVVAEIENYCKSIRPSFVVMGFQDGSAMERLLFGSNIMTAMKKLSWPLIVVSPNATFKNLLNIGVACHLKNAAETIPVEEIRMLVHQFNAKLHVIHVNTENKKSYSLDLIDECGPVQEILKELHPIYYFLINSNIDQGLSVFAEKENIDFLIVSPKKPGLIGNLFQKNHEKKLMLHTHIPVLPICE